MLLEALMIRSSKASGFWMSKPIFSFDHGISPLCCQTSSASLPFL